MFGLARAALCSLFLSVCLPSAFADSLSITGNVSFNPNALTFAPPFATQTDTGVFSAFSDGSVNYLLGTVFYNNALPQTSLAFTVAGADNSVLAFYDEVNSPTQTIDNAGNLDVTLDETGYYTFNGGPAMDGTFDLRFDGTSPQGSLTNVGFLGVGELTSATTTAVTPEPGSYLLMGTGFLVCAIMLRGSRRRVARTIAS